MVMATPSPQQVGREFVRQYYTVLHEAPDVLHRFYSSGSTFVHGGVDRPGLTEEPVTGQLEIDKKIKLLNFKDCHTKIRQVDSQSTIGNGVVVQVTGELSNNGEPMRRFMQTFVLAPQTPKKFYVHNDIFRYQDEVYQDNSDTESEDPQQTETTLNNKSNNSTTPVSSNLNMNYYQGANDQQLETSEVNVVINPAMNAALTSSLSTSITSSSSSSSANVSTTPSSQAVLQQQENVASQNVEIVEQQAVVDETITANTTIVNGHGSGAESVNHLDEASVSVETSESVGEKPTEIKSNTSSMVTGKEELKQEINQNTETKSSTGHSWAKIISTGQSTSSISSLEQTILTGTNPQIYQQNPANTPNTSNSASSQQKRVNGNSSNSYNNNLAPKGQTNKPRNQQQPISLPAQQQTQQPAQQQPQQQSQSQQQTQQRMTDANSLDDEKRFGRYPDGQQVFVGNLNQDLSEEDLKNFFNRFGKVIDVRINTNSKQQSGRRLPNYGFVVFEDKPSVENLLNASKANSLTLRNEKGEYRLNVEEKRARQGRMSTGFGNGVGKGNRVTRSSSNGSRNAPNGHINTSQKKNTNYSQTNDNNGPVSGSNGGSGFIERRKTDVHENQMNENGSQRKNNIRRS